MGCEPVPESSPEGLEVGIAMEKREESTKKCCDGKEEAPYVVGSGHVEQQWACDRAETPRNIQDGE